MRCPVIFPGVETSLKTSADGGRIALSQQAIGYLDRVSDINESRSVKRKKKYAHILG